MNQQIQSPVAHAPTLETEGAAYNAICPRMDASRRVPQALTAGETYTAAELCDKLGITAESITTKPKYSGQSVLDAVDGLAQPGKSILDIEPSPLAQAVHELSVCVTDEIEEDPSGLFTVYGPHVLEIGRLRGSKSTSTEQCAEVSVALGLPMESFDARKKLPRQVAKWVRQMAARLQEAADRIEAIDDDRDLKAIRKLFKAGSGSQGLQPVA